MAEKINSTIEHPFQTAFIIGSPRSGTTILGEILESHPGVAYFYEPYYIWYYHTRDLSTDYIPREDIGPVEAAWIRRQFHRLYRTGSKNLVVDKSPEHSFNIPIIQYVFPEAKFIHIIRDGRDVTLSIKKEWLKRKKLVERQDPIDLVKTVNNMLKRQPLLYFRLLAIWYELKNNFSLSKDKYFNKAKWRGEVGWGPRFRGWEEILDSVPLINFHARQWLECLNQIQHDLQSIPPSNILEIYYENLVSENSQKIIEQVLSFLDLPPSADFQNNRPAIKTFNTRKWSRELSREEIEEITPVLQAKLIDLGYEPA